MSKRKSRTKSLIVDRSDMVFEDDSDPDVAFTMITNSEKPKDKVRPASTTNSNDKSVRISARGKKPKNIYDPSEYNGPVHKKKKEALEAAQISAASKKLASPKKIAISEVPQTKAVNKTPSKTPIKVPKTANQVAIPKQKTSADLKRKLNLDNKSEIEIIPPAKKAATPEPEVTAIVKPVKLSTNAGKEPSKRIQARKLKQTQPIPSATATRERSPSVSCNSEFEKASTVELSDKKILDVSKWTCDDVSAYFSGQGFDKKEALKFKEQEIDGETLLILHRDDLKNLNLKVGTFVKMWNRILRFQTGSNSFSQSWK